MYTLAIDTSNYTLGIAVMNHKKVVGEIVTNLKKNHSLRLMPAIDMLLAEIEIEAKELGKIVVAKGPGSYTGVRIGLTTAKTLAWALDIPLVGVSSLESLAYQASFYHNRICPFFDARRGMVYIGNYEWRQSRIMPTRDDMNILMTEWLEVLQKEQKEVLFLSPDIEKYTEIIKEKMGSLAIIPEETFHIAKPSGLALAGYHYDAISPHLLTPNYIRLTEAEVKWKQKQEDQKNNG